MSFWTYEEEILNNGAGGGISSGKGLTLTLARVNAYTTNTNIEEIGDYTIHYYPAELDEPVNGTQYIDDSGRVVTPTMLVCRGNALAYQISFDVSEKIADLGYTISSIANATYADNASVKSQTFALEKISVYEITAPAAAKVQMFDQLNNFNVMEIKENSNVTNEDGTVTHKFISHGANSITYRVSMEGKITRAGYPNYYNGPKNITIEFEENENPKTTENVMDKESIQKRAESSTLVNVNAQNNLSIDVGETFRLRSFRGAWQIINSDTENIMIEPDFNYNIISILISRF